jgi:hypothetical protein
MCVRACFSVRARACVYMCAHAPKVIIKFNILLQLMLESGMKLEMKETVRVNLTCY